MSETSSDTESSCGWTIISNESSDFETLGSEAAVECGAGPLERPPAKETKLQGTLLSESAAECVEENIADETLGDAITDETVCDSKTGDNSTEEQLVFPLSSSDHSDIVTLGDLREDEQVEVELEAEPNKELYLGTPCSSQYTFTNVETVVPVQQVEATNTSSSSGDEARQSSSTAVRKRRLRKNTTSIGTEPDEEEEEEEEGEVVPDSGQCEEWREGEDEGQQEEETEVRPVAGLGVPTMQGEGSSILNKCVLIALIVAISMGFGHFQGTVQIQERKKTMDKTKLNEVDGMRDLLYQHVGEQPFINQVQRADFDLDDLDDHTVVSLLMEVIKKVKKENQELNIQQMHIKAQRDDLEVLLKKKTEESTNIVSQQQRLKTENQQLKSSLEGGEKSLSTLQEELRNLQSKTIDLEAMGAGADSLLSENHRLKDQLEQDKQLIQSFQSQKENMMVEAQTLRKTLDEEKRVTDELRKEMKVLRKRIHGGGKEAKSGAEELQHRLKELEQQLGHEQQRSDMWKRLYVENKEERAKGDTESKVKNSKQGVAGKMKETFDALKNSTKEFVHHHKVQIKKAKEAVKENLRKFSDSVKLTFRNFKDSASTFINKAGGFHGRSDEKNTKESWQYRSHKHSDKFGNSFQSDDNTRKSGGKAQKDQGHKAHRSILKGCSEVFECAYQESMSLFNRAMEPIRADEFYQLLRSYLQQEVDHFQHWKELERFINNFFHNGLFIHDRMPFTDFVNDVEDYLSHMHEYHGLDDDVFGDLDDYVYRHFFGEAYTKVYGPHRPFERPNADVKDSGAKHQRRKQQRARSRNRSGRDVDRHMADVKIELGPMPVDPKY